MVMWIGWEDGGWKKDGIGEGMELLGIVVLVELILSLSKLVLLEPQAGRWYEEL